MLANNRWRAGWAPARTILKKISRKDERGVTLVEYALLLALIAVVAVGSLVLLGNTVNNTLTQVADQVISKGNANDTITAIDGTPQSAAINAAFGTDLEVLVENQNHQPVSGMTITFSAPETTTSASGQFGTSYSATAVTNGAGQATAPTFTANGQGGSYQVSAGAIGVINKASFSLKNDGAGDTYDVSSCTGTGQTAETGEQFGTELSVSVTDDAGQPSQGLTVTFTGPSSGASVGFGSATGSYTTSTTTGTSGAASSGEVFANTVTGSYNVTVNVYLGSATTGTLEGSATCALQNTPNGEVISASTGGGQSADTNASFSGPIVALVEDVNNNPIEGITVTFTVPDGTTTAGGTFVGDSCTGNVCTVNATTNANGLAVSPVLTANGNVGTFTVDANATGATGGPATFGETILNPFTSYTINIVQGNDQSAVVDTAFQAELEVQVTYGFRTEDGITVTFNAPTSGASGTFNGGASCTGNSCSGATAGGGYFAADLTANNVVGDNYSVTVSAPNAASVTFTESNLSTSADTMSIVAGSPQAAGVGSAYGTDLEVNISNASGNVSGVTVTFTAPTSGVDGNFDNAYFGPSTETGTTGSNGDATAPILYAGTTAGTFTVTATAPDVVSVSFDLTIDSENIAFVNGAGQGAYPGDIFPQRLQVQVTQGIFGAPVQGATVTLTAPTSGATGTFTGAGCTASSCTLTTDYNGNTPLITLTAGSTTGTYSITAASTGTAGASATETNLGYTLSWAAGSDQETAINTAFATPPTVLAEDTATHTAVVGVPITFTITPGRGGASGTFSGAANCSGTTCVVDTAGNGEASVPTLTANGTGGYFEVSATAPAALGINTYEENATYTLVAYAGTPQSAGTGTAFVTPLEVQVQDQYGLAVGGVTVTFTAGTGTGGSTGSFSTGSTATATSDDQGYATAPTFTANDDTGTYTVSATATAATNTATFQLTNTAYTITELAGTPQTAGLGATFGTDFEVRVTNGRANVDGAVVVFTAPTSGASGTFDGGYGGACYGQTTCTVTTGYNGTATAPDFIANTTAGPYTVTAQAEGATNNPVNFALTNAPYTLSVAGNTSPQTTGPDAPFAHDLETLLQAGGTNAPAGIPVTYTVTAGAGGTSGTFTGDGCGYQVTTCTVNTGNNGIATAPTLTANGTPGAFSVVSSTAGSSSTATFNLTVAPYIPSAYAGTGTQTAGEGGPVPNNLETVLQAGTVTAPAGVNVTYTVVAGATGASGTFSGGGCGSQVTTCTVATDNNGVATAPTLTANGTAGTFTVVASTPDTTTTATFTITLYPYVVTTELGSGQDPNPGGAYSEVQVKVTVNGAAASGVNVTFSTPTTGPSATFGGACAGDTCTVQTNGTGYAAIATGFGFGATTLTANHTAGAFSPGLTVTVGTTTSEISESVK